MSLQLTFLPFDSDFYSHTILRTGETCDDLKTIIADIVKAKGRDVPEQFNTYMGRLPTGEIGYGNTTEDPYGDPVKYVKVCDLVALKDNYQVTRDWQNVATWAYLAALPADTKVAVYWS